MILSDVHPGRVKRRARRWACWHWKATSPWQETQLRTWRSWSQCSSADWQRDLGTLWPWRNPIGKVRGLVFPSRVVTAERSILEPLLLIDSFLYRWPHIPELQEGRAHHNNQRRWVFSETRLDKGRKRADKKSRSHPRRWHRDSGDAQQAHHWGHGRENSKTHPSQVSQQDKECAEY